MFRKFPVKVSSISPHSRYSTYLTGLLNKINASAFKLFASEQESSQWNKLGNEPRIDLAKPTDTNSILAFIEKNFFCNDPLCRSLNLCYTKLDKTLEYYVRESLSQGMTVVARGNSEKDPIVGVCINQKSCRWDSQKLIELTKISQNINSKKLLHIWALLAREPCLHDCLSQLQIFELKLISVERSRKSQELSNELVRHSLELGRDMNYNFAKIDATNESLVAIAENFLMEKSWDVAYRNILTEDEKTPVTIMGE